MSSHVSQRIRSIPPSGLLKFFGILATMDDVLSLGIGEPDFPTPPPICEAGIASIHRGETGYTSNAGVLELRQEIARHLARRYGVQYAPDDEILVTVGVSEALHAAILSLVDPGDAVLLPEPCFVAYDPCVRFANGLPVPVVTRAEDGFQVTGEELGRALAPRTKALLLSYPNNPTGAVMERERLLEVARFAEAHDLIVISDEIYDRFVYGMEHTCFASLPGLKQRTVLLGGFSKSHAMTGWRIGYACGPREIIQAMHKVHQYIIMSAPTMAQMGILGALGCDDDCAQGIVREFAMRREIVVEGLRRIGLPCVEPRGAIYAFPSIAHTGLSSSEFSERLLCEEKVAVVPGNAFGASGEGYVRVAYTVPAPRLEEAFERLKRFVERL
jgi:aminotransferase